MNRAIAEPDLDPSRQRDYVLAARCVVPIGKSAGFDPAEGNATGGLRRRLFRDLAGHERKRQFFEMGLTVTTTIQPKDWHLHNLPQKRSMQNLLSGLARQVQPQTSC